MRIEHVAIYAKDLHALKDFYVRCFGMRVIVDNSAAPIAGFFLEDDRGGVLEIIRKPADSPPVDQKHVCHLAFEPEDYDATAQTLRAEGLAFEPDTAIMNDRVRTEFFADPEGNRLQIISRAKPLGT